VFFGNQQQQFYHIARNPELIITKDRDVVGFWPDIMQLSANTGMTIYRDEAKTFVQYSTASAEDVLASQRALVWGRMSGDEIVGGLRWVPYIVSNDVDEIDILPLREVIAPRVVYERTSNTLSLWFWTNVKNDYQGVVYDETQLQPVLTPEFGLQVPTPPADAKRVLCYAIGSFYTAYIEGGGVSGFQTTASATEFDTFDLVPVFTRPRILNWTQDSSNSAGAVVDGWYGGFQGFQGPGSTGGTAGTGVQVRVVHGVQFSQGRFQVRYKDVVVLQDLNTTNWIDVFLTATCGTGM
jgi:hypothetical protein